MLNWKRARIKFVLSLVRRPGHRIDIKKEATLSAITRVTDFLTHASTSSRENEFRGVKVL